MKIPALLLLIFASALASAQEAKVRTSLATQGDLWVGQRATLVVELLAPGFFSGAPAFDLPDTPGLLLVPPSGSPTVGSETIDGTSYTVQRHELAIFTRRPGGQTIPSFTVRFHFKRHPLDKVAVAATVKTEPVRFTAKPPPGAEKLGSLISAHDLKVDEMWKPEPGKAKAGDAFTRTITYSAPDVPGMAFPPFLAGGIDGLGIYPKPGEVLDESDRGNLTGKRSDTITYVCQRPGRFVIPAVRLTWFDLAAQRLRVIDFPARTLDVASNPAIALAQTADSADDGYRSMLVALSAVLGINAVVLLLWKTRNFWSPVVELFRPVHLAPLNPKASISHFKS